MTCHILNEVGGARRGDAQLAHSNKQPLCSMVNFVRCDDKYAGVISKLLGNWAHCASVGSALEFLRQHPSFVGSIATGCGALCLNGGREIRRHTAAEASAILKTLSTNGCTLQFHDAQAVSASADCRQAEDAGNASSAVDNDGLAAAVKACDIERLQLIQDERGARQQMIRLHDEQRSLEASCAALHHQFNLASCPLQHEADSIAAQRTRLVLERDAQRDQLRQLRATWQAQLDHVPLAEKLREQCLELENALELNDFKQRDVAKKQRAAEESISAANQACGRLTVRVACKRKAAHSLGIMRVMLRCRHS